MWIPRYLTSLTHGIIWPDKLTTLAHETSWRGPIRKQDDFLKLISMSRSLSSRSQSFNKFSNAVTEGANNKICLLIYFSTTCSYTGWLIGTRMARAGASQHLTLQRRPWPSPCNRCMLQMLQAMLNGSLCLLSFGCRIDWHHDWQTWQILGTWNERA